MLIKNDLKEFVGAGEGKSEDENEVTMKETDDCMCTFNRAREVERDCARGIVL